jgi:hypothetical protein
MRWLFAIVILFFGLPHLVLAQYGNFPLNNDFNQIVLGGSEIERYNSHTSLKPFDAEQIDSLKIRLTKLDIKSDSKVIKLVFNSDTTSPQKDLIHLSLTPILNAQYAFGKTRDSNDAASTLGIGLNLFGFAGRNLTFGFDFTYSKSQYADYVEDYIETKGVIPGFGKADKKGDYYYNRFYNGFLAYRPAKFLRLEAGKGKQFIGNGHRSLLLSDNSTSYPYLKINLEIWKFNYQILYSYLENATYDFWHETWDIQPKYSTSNNLSMNFGKNWNLGLFQSVVWHYNAETNRGFDVNYLNPIVFMRPVEFSIGSPDNVLMGMDVRYTFLKKYSLYGQVVLDEFLLSELKKKSGWWGNKYGVQAGIKAHDLFKLKGLSAQVEFNWVRPYTYSHSNANQNYGHFNEALAHTLGANFKEYIGRFSYVKHRWMLSAHLMLASKGVDFEDIVGPNYSFEGDPFYAVENYGGNIFKSNSTRNQDYDNVTTQGNLARITYAQLKLSYLAVPDWRLMFEAGYSMRSISHSGQWVEGRINSTNYMFFFGIKTALFNQYLDF